MLIYFHLISSPTIINNHNLFIIHVFKLSNRWVGIHNDDHLLISLKYALNKNHKITYFKFLKLSMLFFINHNFDFFFVNLKIMFIQARSRPISKLITSLVLLLFFFKEKTKTDRWSIMRITHLVTNLFLSRELGNMMQF